MMSVANTTGMPSRDSCTAIFWMRLMSAAESSNADIWKPTPVRASSSADMLGRPAESGPVIVPLLRSMSWLIFSCSVVRCTSSTSRASGAAWQKTGANAQTSRSASFAPRLAVFMAGGSKTGRRCRADVWWWSVGSGLLVPRGAQHGERGVQRDDHHQPAQPLQRQLLDDEGRDQDAGHTAERETERGAHIVAARGDEAQPGNRHQERARAHHDREGGDRIHAHEAQHDEAGRIQAD